MEELAIENTQVTKLSKKLPAKNVPTKKVESDSTSDSSSEEDDVSLVV